MKPASAGRMNPARCGNRCYIVRIALRDLGESLFRRGIDRREILARMRRDELAVDEVLITRPELDVIVRLGRRRIAPAIAEVELALVRRERDARFRRERLLCP